jgi:hypothetical protein
MITLAQCGAKLSLALAELRRHNEAMRTVDDVRERVRAEYLEMPGLHLTIDQVQRLCGIERRMCTTVLDHLVEEHFLCVKPNGAYARAWEGFRPRIAKAARHALITGRRAS